MVQGGRSADCGLIGFTTDAIGTDFSCTRPKPGPDTTAHNVRLHLYHLTLNWSDIVQGLSPDTARTSPRRDAGAVRPLQAQPPSQDRGYMPQAERALQPENPLLHIGQEGSYE